MNNTPKTLRWGLFALVLVLILACGSVFAYMFQRTEPVSTTFVPVQVTCDIEKEVTQDSNTNQDVVSKIETQNTSTIKAYIRVRLVTYWVDQNGDVAPKSSPDLEIDYAQGWIPGKDDTIYYYKPVEVNETQQLIAKAVTLKTDGEYRQALDVFVEAIQAEPATAVVESWGVTLDTAGIIETVP